MKFTVQKEVFSQLKNVCFGVTIGFSTAEDTFVSFTIQRLFRQGMS